MGDRGNLPAIADAGPLIHLAEIEGLRLLTQFNPIHLPGEVWRETIGRGRLSERDLSAALSCQRHEVPPNELAEYAGQLKLERLHRGERECLWLSSHLGVVTLLTDDLAVRDAARKLRITPVGSLGIVIRACHLSLITRADAEGILMELYDSSSLYVTRTIVELALEHLDQRSPGHR